MKRILLATNYPNLHSLVFVPETASKLFR
ncbi:unnamed protein product, partial [Rotaria magnacalcarata]